MEIPIKKVFAALLGCLLAFASMGTALMAQDRNGGRTDTTKNITDDDDDAADDEEADGEADNGTDAGKKKDDLFHLTLGGKGYHNSGGAPTYTYWKPFTELELTTTYFFLKAGYYRYIGYQITDGSGNYEYIGFNQYAGELGLTPFKWLEVSGGYHFSEGEFRYKAHEYSGELVLDFDIITLTGSYDRKLEEYFFSTKVGYTNTNTDTYNGALAVNPGEHVSIEGSYQYSNAFYVQFDDNYTKHLGRLGATILPMKELGLTLGGEYGQDSARYVLYGGDAGFTLKLFGRLKFLASYTYLWYQAPLTTTAEKSNAKSSRPKPNQAALPASAITTNAGLSSATNAPQTGTNPYVRTSLINESYANHAVVFGVTLRI
ncbi:MAG TPA: hypothetical protein PKM65_15710 [Spirochaetota bacterium]|nr:hypothetical protein [Spirochaetota bacterium]HNT11901.1 hypothetical protein [Spirochaetota bacterium]